jgi:hypothetical protein
MGLINLKTDLKSLRFGKDRIGGGDSGQPYIIAPIPDGVSYRGIGTTDFLLRGGINTAADSLEDVRRLGKMFFDTKSPNGLLFIAKQQLLSRTAVRTQTSGILNEGTYTPLNTLAQAGVIAFGNHLNKQGVDPFADSGAYSTNINLYQNKVKPSQSVLENRLTELLRGSYQNIPIPYDSNQVILNNGTINVMTYTGGPGSNLGEGNTNIRYSRTSQTLLTLAPKTINQTQINSDIGENDWTYSSEMIETQPRSVESFGIASPKAQDFRKILREKLGETTSAGKAATNSGATPYSLNYSGEDAGNIENRVKLGDPGQRAGKNYANYVVGVSYPNIDIKNIGTATSGLDRITSIPIYRSEAVVQDDTVNDLVKFRIAIIDNDSPNFKTFIHFRAFIDSMSDSYSANWNSYNYLGRGENFYTYNGFTRNISLSWTVAAQSKQELIPMHTKLNYLASSLTPDYAPSPKGYMRGNLAQLTIGGYLYEQPGIITSLTYDIPEESPWEIGIGNTKSPTDNSVKELPHIIRVTGFNFIPIQRFLPRIQQNGYANNFANGSSASNVGFAREYGDEQYIALTNGFTNNYDDTSLASIKARSRAEVQQIPSRGL